MSWMFPYASLVLTASELGERGVGPLEAGATFGELSSYLCDTRDQLREDYEASIAREVNNIVPGISTGWRGSPFFENYSLKFSNTSNSYTAYVFEYRRVDAAELGELDLPIPHLWVPLSDALAFLADANHLAGRTVSSNVIDLVRATV